MVYSFLFDFDDEMFQLTSALDFGHEKKSLKWQTIYCIYPTVSDR